MLIEAAKGGHTNVVSILIDYPNSLVMTNEAALSAAAFNDGSINSGSGGSNTVQGGAHPGSHHTVQQTQGQQVCISGQMTQEQVAIAMQQEQHNAQGKISSTHEKYHYPRLSGHIPMH